MNTEVSGHDGGDWKPVRAGGRLGASVEAGTGGRERARADMLTTVREKIDQLFAGIDLTKNTRMRTELARILSDAATSTMEPAASEDADRIALESARERAFSRIQRITDEHWEKFES